MSLKKLLVSRKSSGHGIWLIDNLSPASLQVWWQENFNTGSWLMSLPLADRQDSLMEGQTVASAPDIPQAQRTSATPALIPVIGAALTLAACGGSGSTPAPAPAPGGGQTSTVAKPATDEEAARFLLKTQFSASDDEMAALRTQGYEPWLNTQMSAAIGQTAFDWLSARGYDQITTNAYFDNFYPGDYAMWQQLLSANGTDGVRKRAALALSEIFVVGFSSLDIQWRSQAIAHYWDVLVAGAFGTYRQLLENVTLNAAMGVFLNTKGNQKEDTRTGRQPDENYAREVMQLFSLGLDQLNTDGTTKRDAQGVVIPAYTQEDITNLARVFTGYDWDRTGNVKTPDARGNGRIISDTKYAKLPMTLDGTKFDPPITVSRHSNLEAKFLGVTIPANTDGTVALKTALDTLANHPNVGPFISRQLIQRLITSNPSPAFISRIAAKFNDNGSGVRGDLRAVFMAIFMDTESLGAANLTSTTFGKVREPIVRLTQWARTFGATSASGNWPLADQSSPGSALGQSPMRAPSVFNFFRPGYVPANTAIATGNLVAPEFQIISEVSTAAYVNYMSGVVSNNLANRDIRAAYTKELALITDVPALVNRLSLLLTGGQLSDASKATIRTAVESIAVTATSTDAVKLNRLATAILLVMAAPEYLVQK
jgi:uncharacterized protein (DUF1800 family)